MLGVALWGGILFDYCLQNFWIKKKFFLLEYESVSCPVVAQSCKLFCDPMDCSLPVSSVQGFLKARILEWVPFPSPGDLPDSRIEPMSPTLQAYSLPPGKPKRRKWQLTPVFLPKKFHGQRSLAGYHPWDHKKL